MGKKLKTLAGGLSENQLAQTVKDSAHQIWLAGLGAFAKAQEEGGKVFDALVREGEGIQARTRKLTDEKIAVVTGKAADEAQPAGRTFLHRGIAKRAFERRFQLADVIKVTGATFENGLLNIDLKREVPEHKKPRKVEIGTDGALIEGEAA